MGSHRIGGDAVLDFKAEPRCALGLDRLARHGQRPQGRRRYTRPAGANAPATANARGKADAIQWDARFAGAVSAAACTLHDAGTLGHDEYVAQSWALHHGVTLAPTTSKIVLVGDRQLLAAGLEVRAVAPAQPPTEQEFVALLSSALGPGTWARSGRCSPASTWRTRVSAPWSCSGPGRGAFIVSVLVTRVRGVRPAGGT